MMLSLVDLVITLKFASWANRFSGGNEDSMYSLDQLQQFPLSARTPNISAS